MTEKTLKAVQSLKTLKNNPNDLINDQNNNRNHETKLGSRLDLK